MKKALSFEIKTRLNGTLARTGVIQTPHGEIKTPAYIAGGTNATVKAMTPEQIRSTGAQAVLANTYHLMLRPGADILAKAGGIHKFMNWNAPTFTDSGGFQVFSLGMAYKKGIDATSHISKGDSNLARHNSNQLAKVGEDGVWFKSHISGEKIFMSPEISMELQHKIGADIHMAFDELTSPLAGRAQIKSALDKTHFWAEKCLKRHNELNTEHIAKGENLQALFAVVQGAREEDFRKESASFLGSKNFDGFGIGGIFQAWNLVLTHLTVWHQLVKLETVQSLLILGELILKTPSLKKTSHRLIAIAIATLAKISQKLMLIIFFVQTKFSPAHLLQFIMNFS